MTPHHLRTLCALIGNATASHGSPPPAVAWAIAHGFACIDEGQTERYPERGTTYRLTSSGREAMTRVEPR